MNSEPLWWQKPLRVIQTNLQVRDTPKMDPEKIAAEMEQMGANTLVTNVGGIYAWYSSKVKYHTINEYLPQQFDLLESLIAACHKRDIKLVARFDFSKAEDQVYQERPWWFVRNPDHSPHAYGAMRPGPWSLLYTTCINGGYRNEEVAVPVIREVLQRYRIDGIFFNAPHYELCFCQNCRQKYREVYGYELPLSKQVDERQNSTFASRNALDEMEKDWPSICVRDNISKIYNTVKDMEPDCPVILYYSPYSDNLNDRTATADMLCTESQNVLSLGSANIPAYWHPAVSMKVGCSVENRPSPFGIIHSCPGMDWRHTGLPPAEYQFWMAQVPANGGSIWHSITGFNDTITDKRILHAVSATNHMIKQVEEEMEHAQPDAQILLIWNYKTSGEGWAESLTFAHKQFALLGEYQLNREKLATYKTVVLPNNTGLAPASIQMLEEYVKNGGSLLMEECENASSLAELAGMHTDCAVSEYLTASYLRFSPDCGMLQAGLEETQLIAHRGITIYCRPKQDTQTLATLVPPFAPLVAVGAPPERASMHVSHTDLPLVTLRKLGSGRVLYLSFALSELIAGYKLNEHYRLAGNCMDLLLDGAEAFSTDAPFGVQAVVWKKKGKILFHFINGIGQRPLVENIPVYNLSFHYNLSPDYKVVDVSARISGQTVQWEQQGTRLCCTLPLLKVWDMVAVDLQE